MGPIECGNCKGNDYLGLPWVIVSWNFLCIGDTKDSMVAENHDFYDNSGMGSWGRGIGRNSKVMDIWDCQGQAVVRRMASLGILQV